MTHISSISPAFLFSQATFIPWMGIGTEGSPDRGLYWGIRRPDFIVSGVNLTAVMMADTRTGPKPETEKR